MNTFSKQKPFQRTLVRRLTVAAIVLFASTHGLDGPGARAAMRLPEESLSLEPWLVPSGGIPTVVETPQTQELAPPQDAPRRPSSLGSARAAADRARRPSASRREKQALAEFMGLVGSSREGQTVIRSFESLQSCREFVAINC